MSARSIGRDCWINQQVTIGFTNKTDCPRIGDGVTIGVGAIVIGDIVLGDGATVGAGAVVVHDVPAGATVVGVPARTLQDLGSHESVALP